MFQDDGSGHGVMGRSPGEVVQDSGGLREQRQWDGGKGGDGETSTRLDWHVSENGRVRREEQSWGVG